MILHILSGINVYSKSLEFMKPTEKYSFKLKIVINFLTINVGLFASSFQNSNDETENAIKLYKKNLLSKAEMLQKCMIGSQVTSI